MSGAYGCYADVALGGHPTIDAAMGMAKRAHHGQRYGIEPYVTHLATVATITALCTNSIDVIAAAWLHDSIEDTVITRDGISAVINSHVASLVDAVTDGVGGSRAERKLRPYRLIPEAPDAIVIKLADRIANVNHCVLTQNRRLALMYYSEDELFREMLLGSPAPSTRNDAVDLWRQLENDINDPRFSGLCDTR